MSIAIQFDNISKQYRLGLVSTRTLSHDLNRWYQVNIRRREDPYLRIGETNDRASRGDSEYVWALRDINLSVEQGEVLGIIGKNGAGKSTLLKILSKVTAPTTGSIRARGRIASLLEVGTGFHPEMTGRENIFMNGAIMGMTKAEIRRKLDEIIDFAGVERYIDTPVKRYSSGMTVRLGFAVAAHLEPEILVVDEVLAVGDAEFQKKAIGKMQDVSHKEGRTVLFVSHNMDAVQRLCNRGIMLKDGTVSFADNIERTIKQYQNIFIYKRKSQWESDSNISAGNQHFIANKFALFCNFKPLEREITDGDCITVLIEFTSESIVKNLTIGVSVFDERDMFIYRSLHTDFDSCIYLQQVIGTNRLTAKLPIDFLKPGYYQVALDVSYYNETWIVNPFEKGDQILSFSKAERKDASLIQASGAAVGPLIKWEFNNE